MLQIGKKKSLNQNEIRKTRETLGPKEWELKMQELSRSHKQVKWKRHNLIVSNYNQHAYKKLNQIRYSISETSSDIISMIPSARWLFDNFQMMYREIKKVKTSGTGYEALPNLRSGEWKGYPRIYVIAQKMVAYSGGYLNEDNILMMIRSYQKELPLTDRELWALPEMIGLCLLERIIEVSEDIIHRIRTKSQADRYVKEKLSGQPGLPDITPLLKKTNLSCSENRSFHCHVLYLLKNMSFDDDSLQKYISFHCGAEKKYINPNDLFQEEGKIESLLESNIRTLIVSLREINQVDDEKLFENLSTLEQLLLKDPEDIYRSMDSDSRGLYRGVLEKLAYRYGIQEKLIGEACLTLATEGRDDLNCSHHVGAYIIGKGFPLLKARILNKQVPKSITDKKNYNGLLYFCICIIALLGVVWLFISALMPKGDTGLSYQGILLTLIAAPILIGIALELTNNIVTRLIPVQKLPSMDYMKEIPDTARTFVVMPVIVSSRTQALEYLNRLQKYYLANSQNNLYFALLADYSDADQRTLPEDEIIKEALIRRTNELNEKYPGEQQRFSLFIRYRSWNRSEDCFMAWERKRGKLEEFNSLLFGAEDEETTFSTILCDREILTTFKYVITLDSDSSLIRDNASKLVGLIDHPLNRPVMDLVNLKVKEGYAIIQPSVRNHIADRKSSFFQKQFGGQTGLVHYATLVSDVYQDVFGQGSYIGKGIYHINAFHQILRNAIPENTVLSHDLLESCYVRTAFAGTVNILDNFPNSVLAYARREHRWIRGDWQLIPWIFRKKNLSGISRWKMLDNLRRSLVPVCKTILILLNIVFFPEEYYVYLPVVFFSELLNLLILLINIILNKINRPRLMLVRKKLGKDTLNILARALTETALIPYKAFITTDAVLRTLYRVFVSRKNLLKWKTSESIEKSILGSRKDYLRNMWIQIVVAVGLAALIILRKPPLPGVLLYLTLALLWGFSYELAYRISQPGESGKRDELPGEELLYETARRIWQFFRDFTTRENNWLCPDNYQFVNKVKVTSKTSPTNIGLQLLSILSARDFGFETLSSTIDYLENTLYTVAVLPKWRGHLFNWYNIKTLEVLNPQYISTVDSGNFCGDLIALKYGILEQKTLPIISRTMIAELKEKLRLSKVDIKLREDYRTMGDFLKDISDIREYLKNKERSPWEDPAMTRELLRSIELFQQEIKDFELEDTGFHADITLLQMLQVDNDYARSLVERIKGLNVTIDNMLENVDFKFLYNPGRRLFHIGYHVSSQTLDAGCYDLMASESALTSFLAIARGEAPVKHWYKLGRPLTMVKGIPTFVSWSGTMFEYLMPRLLLQDYEGSVFEETSKAAVLQQIRYARHKGIPWGISESQYFRFDLDSNYQYRAFGVTGLRLQPSLRDSLVVSPYSTMLALEYAEEEALYNLTRLKEMGVYGNYGFYEAVDFNGPDPVSMTPYCVVKSFMAHHQGMSLIAVNNYLHNGIMRTRFHSEPFVRATEVLLEEKRQTYYVSVSKKGYTVNMDKIELQEEDVMSRRYISKVAPQFPVVNYLSNNTYSVLVTSDGDGFSNCNGLMLHRWRSDLYANAGQYIYIKDLEENRIWSTTYHPTKAEPEEYTAIFSPHMTEFRRRDGEITTYTQISPSSSHNLEIRKVIFTNHSKTEKQLEITSYMELVADSFLAELSHPAFNKLFLESEFLEEHSIFLVKRRSNKGNDNPYIMHMVKTQANLSKSLEYENDRLRFLGRNKTVEKPDAVTESITLSNNAGFSNDPIMSIRVTITLRAEQTASVTFITGVCNTKEEAVKISDELSVGYRVEDIFEKFRRQSEMELKYLNITNQQVNAFQDIISPIFYPNCYYRGPSENIRRNWKNQSFLWRFGVSGDSPIMLLRVSSVEEAGIIKDVLKAYEYLRINQVKVDLIILSEAKHGYMQELTDMLNDMISALKIYDEDRERPSLFILHSYQMIPAEIDLLFTVSRVVFSEKTGIYFRNIRDVMKETYVD